MRPASDMCGLRLDGGLEKGPGSTTGDIRTRPVDRMIMCQHRCHGFGDCTVVVHAGDFGKTCVKGYIE